MDKGPKGFIKLDRAIFEHWIFQDAEKFKAFVDLIQLMRWKDEKLVIGNEVIIVPRGSYYTSELKLSERWGWSRNKTRSYLTLLAKEGMLIKKGTTKGTMLTVVNYELYQGEGITKKHQEDNEKTTKKHQKDNERYTKEEVKEVRRIEKNREEERELNFESLELCKYFSDLLPGQDISSQMATLNIWINDYGYGWTKEAIEICIKNKNRFIKPYIETILKNWAANGKEEEHGECSKQDVGEGGGKYKGFKPSAPKITENLDTTGLI